MKRCSTGLGRRGQALSRGQGGVGWGCGGGRGFQPRIAALGPQEPGGAPHSVNGRDIHPDVLIVAERPQPTLDSHREPRPKEKQLRHVPAEGGGGVGGGGGGAGGVLDGRGRGKPRRCDATACRRRAVAPPTQPRLPRRGRGCENLPRPGCSSQRCCRLAATAAALLQQTLAAEAAAAEAAAAPSTARFPRDAWLCILVCLRNSQAMN